MSRANFTTVASFKEPLRFKNAWRSPLEKEIIFIRKNNSVIYEMYKAMQKLFHIETSYWESNYKKVIYDTKIKK